jgi:hypothetical protein
MGTGGGQIGGNDNDRELGHMKTTRIITAAAGLTLAATTTQLEVIDATGSGRGWRVTIGGDVQVNSFQCATDSTCSLPAPGVTGNVITADPGTGMGAVIFNWTVSGTVTVDLTSGP